MPEEIDTTNRFMVSVGQGGVLIMLPPRGPVSFDDALTFAAWIVTLAEHEAGYSFEDALNAVQST